MRKIILMLLLSLFMTSLSLAGEKPTETSLISAWEQLQKNDPNVATFEKIADRRYKFKTNLFPFDGELRISDTTIDNMEMGLYDDGFISGLLDVELVGLPKDVAQKYSRKYSMWARNNTLYYDKKAGRWLSGQEFQGVIAKRAKEMSKPPGLPSNYVYMAAIVAILLLVGMFVYFMQKNRGAVKTSLERQADSIALVEKSIELGEKGMKLSEETNRILKEILEALKGKA